ncbi:MAG: Cna B-type domain-containing protein, partial [Oscillospiraceae bacterium]|nr:Cna B-type domain-containing protein [Oscillospiraceae bacterium]
YAHSVNGFSHGSKVAFEGGIISNNTATGGWGGGALIEDSTSDFGVNGGRTVFDGNVSAGLGGGVFLRFGMHRIYKATFSDNQANRANSYYDGGAIYIEEYTVAHMKNVFVSGSTTNRNGAAAVAVCPTGELAVYELEGLLSANNQSDMMDIGTIQGGITSAIPKVYLPSHVIGGGEVSYTKSNGTPMDISGLQFVEGFFSLKTVIPANDDGQVVANAKKIAEKDGVVITGNHANEFGAGIMTNGVLKIGTETTTLRVNKVWADGPENHENDQILVYLTQDGKPVSQGFRSDSSVILNKDNNWSYVWSNLGDYETFKWGVKEASVDGYTSEVKVEKDTEYSVIADKYYVATLTNTPNTEEAAKSLVINKTAIGLDPDASYKFTLKLDNVGDGAYAIQLPDGTLNPIFNNEITFYMKDGQSAVVKGLPEGYTYEVTEAEGDYVTHVLDSETLDETGSITVVDVVNIAKTSLTVNKVWAGDDDTAVRPTSILVDLMNGETLVESAVVEPDAEGNWKYIFDDLPMYDAAGDKIAYTVAEVEVPANYTSSQVTDGTVVTITNTYEEPDTPPTITYTSLTVNKAWAGDDGETRPDSVTVQLYRNGAAYGQSRTLNEANGWSTIWTSLNDDYTWTVEEVNVPEGYTASQSRRGTTVTITNTFTEDVEEPDTPTTESPEPTESPDPIESPEPTETQEPDETEDLDETDTPLAENPDEGEDLGDNDTPLAEVPQTGDMLWLWMTLAAGSAVSLAWISAEEKKGKRVSK